MPEIDLSTPTDLIAGNASGSTSARECGRPRDVVSTAADFNVRYTSRKVADRLVCLCWTYPRNARFQVEGCDRYRLPARGRVRAPHRRRKAGPCAAGLVSALLRLPPLLPQPPPAFAGVLAGRGSAANLTTGAACRGGRRRPDMMRARVSASRVCVSAASAWGRRRVGPG